MVPGRRRTNRLSRRVWLARVRRLVRLRWLRASAGVFGIRRAVPDHTLEEEPRIGDGWESSAGSHAVPHLAGRNVCIESILTRRGLRTGRCVAMPFGKI